jgi:uncharacterized protein YcbX/ferredoxin
VQTLTEIYIYPIKSTKGVSLPSSAVDEQGLLFDRKYMLIDNNGTFITGRSHPQLTQIKTEIVESTLSINAANMPTLTIIPTDFSRERIKVKVWSDMVEAIHCNRQYDQWFSAYLKISCRLVFFGETSERFVKNKKTQVAFADGYPLLLINQASLDQLNTRMETPVSALHFRPNLVIKSDLPFIEDSWDRIKIGEVEFEVSKPCTRCPFTNVNPKTGVVNGNKTLDALAKFRFSNGKIDFGQNLVPLNEGIIRTGDSLQVLSSKRAILYGSQFDVNENKKTVQIHYQGSDIKAQGDDQQLLLDQAEQAGISIPHSCRSGKCGRCKVKLINGEVKILNDEGLYQSEKEAGYILPCSTIPKSDLVVNC